ncbi:hypothetical protein VDGL01_11242 [Verticillium dahliae]
MQGGRSESLSGAADEANASYVAYHNDSKSGNMPRGGGVADTMCTEEHILSSGVCLLRVVPHRSRCREPPGVVTAFYTSRWRRANLRRQREGIGPPLKLTQNHPGKGGKEASGQHVSHGWKGVHYVWREAGEV